MGHRLWQLLSPFVSYRSDHALLDELYTHILCFGQTYNTNYGSCFPRLDSVVRTSHLGLKLLFIILTYLHKWPRLMENSSPETLLHSRRQLVKVIAESITQYTYPIECYNDSQERSNFSRYRQLVFEMNKEDNTTV